MVALPKPIENTQDYQGGGALPLIPEGNYQALIVKSEMAQTKDKQGQMIVLTLVVTHGQHEGTEFTERLNVINNNDVAVKIAYATLARITEACGLSSLNDTTELHNKPLMIKVKTESGKPWTDNDGNEREGNDKSVIDKYLPVPSGGVNTAPPQAAAQPSQQAPVEQQAEQAVTSNPFAPPSS